MDGEDTTGVDRELVGGPEIDGKTKPLSLRTRLYMKSKESNNTPRFLTEWSKESRTQSRVGRRDHPSGLGFPSHHSQSEMDEQVPPPQGFMDQPAVSSSSEANWRNHTLHWWNIHPSSWVERKTQQGKHKGTSIRKPSPPFSISLKFLLNL